jgi:serine/threonine-protein kinase RsbW
VPELMADGETVRSDAVEIRVPSVGKQLPILRAVAECFARSRNYDLDGVADFKMSVDEACSCLIALAMPGTTLSCRYRTEGEQLHVTVSTVTKNGGLPDPDTFGWHVLEALTDAVIAVPSVDEDPRAVAIDFVKGKGGQWG